jgi:predicted nucleic acid-binding protein
MAIFVAIQDANIMIDLVKTGLFDHCLALDYNFITTDIIFDELHPAQAEAILPHTHTRKFTVIQTSTEDLAAIQSMSIEDQRISEQDWSAIYFAEQRNALLLTGDGRLRSRAEIKGLTCFGILWIFDQLVEAKILK